MKTNRHKHRFFRVLSNRKVAVKTWEMVLEGDTSDFTAPGQFINIAVEGKYLRRPISVCDIQEDRLILLYDVVGEGTEGMSKMQPGSTADLLTGLGNGFNLSAPTEKPLLVGGGIGCAPLLQLARMLCAEGKRPVVVLGFNTAADVVLKKDFEALGLKVYVSTADGTEGTRGFVTHAIAANNLDFDYFYTCGPLPMLRALCETLEQPGEVSLESRMACGFGICMCCVLETKSGLKGICKAGPVFPKDELIWK